MRALKNNWLRAGITLLFLLGAFFVVRAMSENKEVIDQAKATVKTTVLSPEWFVYKGPAYGTPGYDPYEATNYEPYTGTGTEPTCEGGPQVCSIKLPPGADPEYPDQEALDDKASDISNGMPIQDELQFRNAGT